jgi:hypothetical protein
MLSEWRRRTGAKKTLKVNSRVSSLLQVCPSLTVNYGIRVQTCAWTWFLRLPSLAGVVRNNAQIIRKISETGHRMQPLHRGSIGRVRVGIRNQASSLKVFSSLESTAMIGPSPGTHWLQFGHLASIASSSRSSGAVGSTTTASRWLQRCLGRDELGCGELC